MVPRFAGAIALAVILQLTVTITSRLFPGLGGGYGAPLSVGRVSPLSFYSDRAGVVTFEPWILVVNLVITLLVILPLLPFAKVPSTAAAGFLGGALSYGIWLVRIDPTLPSQSMYPVEYGGMAHPFALWTVLVLGTLAGVYLWRSRQGHIGWTYGDLRLTRAVVAVAVAALIQHLTTWTSGLFPAGDGTYGAPFPVGRTQGLGGGAFLGWASDRTFDPVMLLVNVVLTATLLFAAVPASRALAAGAVGALATGVGYAITVGMILMVFARTGLPVIGFPIPMPVDSQVFPLGLWTNLVLWSVLGLLGWRWRARRSAIDSP